MKSILFSILIFICDFQSGNAQLSTTKNTITKPVLDTSVFGKWASIGEAAISPNGKYAYYLVNNDSGVVRSCYLTATKENWERKFSNVADHVFTGDSRYFLWRTISDSLGITTLSRNSAIFFSNIVSFKLSENKKHQWLAFKQNLPYPKLVLLNLYTGKKFSFNEVADYFFLPLKEKMCIIQEEGNNGGRKNLFILNLGTGEAQSIWKGYKLNNLVFDERGEQISFLGTPDSNNNTAIDIWYFKFGNIAAKRLNISSIIIGKDSLYTENIERFSKDGRSVFLRVRPREGLKASAARAVNVDVWSYTDVILQSHQLRNLSQPSLLDQTDFLLVYSLISGQITRLESEGERLVQRIGDTILITSKTSKGPSESYIEGDSPIEQLCIRRLHEEQCLNKAILKCVFWYMSPGGKYIIYIDPVDKAYYSYSITKNNIKKIKSNNFGRKEDAIDSQGLTGIALNDVQGWLEEDEAIIVAFENDLWLVDPSCNKEPINLTNGYGKKNNIDFKVSLNRGGIFNKQQKIILTAFNLITKENGFYSIRLDGAMDLIRLSMGPFVYDIPEHQWIVEDAPIKAFYTDAYLVKRMSEKESPNYYFTTDFKSFRQISKVNPEANYNWLTTELVNFLTLDGKKTQGVLYKPENFDPNHRYPLIIHYYQKMADRLHVFLPPGFTDGPINIPWFVSNGYLVFTPDIQYTPGQPGKSALNTVVSAAKVLSFKQYIDSTKIGVQGHSFGGYQTSYIVTHCDMFAAACSSAGYSNMISYYGTLTPEGDNRYDYFEFGQPELREPLWKIPQSYLENSPLFSVPNITTPILLMNNINDSTVPFQQGVEFFSALRRLEKKAWMLQYDGEGHSLVDIKAQADFTKRVTQFFNHYLKGQPAPAWMVGGVIAQEKGLK
ncbi:Dipeptidyl aminopeptidase/acylaminoacyl peptidase [Chitinophaga rupis]|uniref:Dipeptidyl aminopeptidase/acylaminoacyl peptidase n=1 Tax=Chitinophaga rupis TaxID=573321 RepID=A0A1H7XYD8_9BACT|nr:prolyl oligopeptidase family serine peptidase [Chitinophaga rupis]SEM38675.1 Dipeptidyl aminopeptidase/acylaminoacyl peptidase [Chitinophaga rupis]